MDQAPEQRARRASSASPFRTGPRIERRAKGEPFVCAHPARIRKRVVVGIHSPILVPHDDLVK
jgi:hypothetical protein